MPADPCRRRSLLVDVPRPRCAPSGEMGALEPLPRLGRCGGSLGRRAEPMVLRRGYGPRARRGSSSRRPHVHRVRRHSRMSERQSRRPFPQVNPRSTGRQCASGRDQSRFCRHPCQMLQLRRERVAPSPAAEGRSRRCGVPSPDSPWKGGGAPLPQQVLPEPRILLRRARTQGWAHEVGSTCAAGFRSSGCNAGVSGPGVGRYCPQRRPLSLGRRGRG